jgi:hypothetical protein
MTEMAGIEYVQDELPGMEDENQFRPEIVHLCPLRAGLLTPCCGYTVFELPRTDRITLDINLVTCGLP